MTRHDGTCNRAGGTLTGGFHDHRYWIVVIGLGILLLTLVFTPAAVGLVD